MWHSACIIVPHFHAFYVSLCSTCIHVPISISVWIINCLHSEFRRFPEFFLVRWIPHAQLSLRHSTQSDNFDYTQAWTDITSLLRCVIGVASFLVVSLFFRFTCTFLIPITIFGLINTSPVISDSNPPIHS